MRVTTQSVPRSKRKGKSNPKGRVKSRRVKTRGGNVLGSAPGALTRIPSMQFQADAARARHRYVSIVNVTPGAAGLNLYAFGINTPRVPDRTSSAGQSQGWASMSALYKRYVCLGSKIRWSMSSLGSEVNTHGATVVRGVLFPIPASSATLTNIEDVQVQKYSKSWSFPAQDSSVTLLSSGDPRSCWRGRSSMTVSKLEGEPNLRSSNYEALISADPTIIDEWGFFWEDVWTDSANTLPRLTLEVDIEYDVIWFDRIGIINTLEERAPRLNVVLPKAVSVGDTEQKTPSPPETVDRYTLVDVEAFSVRKDASQGPATPFRQTLSASRSVKVLSGGQPVRL